MNTDFNDLKYITAIAEGHSLNAAAISLDVNHATVFRRINQIEKRLGVRLFNRNAGVYTTTPAGEELAKVGHRLNHEANEAYRKVQGADISPSGLVRITTTASIAQLFLGEILQQCRTLYPEIKLELIISQDYLNLSKRDADIAIRPTLNPPEHLLGKKIAPMAIAPYVAKDQFLTLAMRAGLSTLHASSMLSAEELKLFEWVSMDDTFSQSTLLKWFGQLHAIPNIPLRVNSMSSVKWGCVYGFGLGLLPCFIGDSEPSLRRVAEPLPDYHSELWLLMHPDLRNTTRVKMVFDLLHRELIHSAVQLKGERMDQ